MLILLVNSMFSITFAQLPQRYVDYTGGQNYIPFNFSSNKAQWLYYPSEFTGGPMMPGTITKIYIKAAQTVNNVTQTNLTIKLGTTSLTGLTSGLWNTAGMVTVLSVPAFVQTASLNQWVEHTLTTPFYYNGTSNLILEVSVDGINAGGYTVYQGSLSTNRRMYGLANSTSSQGADGTQAAIGFDMITECTGAPDGGVATATADTVACTQSGTVNLSGATSMPGISHVWQYSTDKINWTTTTVATNNYVHPSLNVPTYFRALVSCSFSGLSSVSTMDSIYVHTVPINWSADTILCPGHTIVMDPNINGASYLWSTGATSPTIVVNYPGTYSVTVVQHDGCISSATQEVHDVPYPTGDFTITRVGFTEYQFVSRVQNASTIEWDFGDGSPRRTGTLITHNYTTPGMYMVRMYAKNVCDIADISAISLEVKGTSINDLEAQYGIKIYPNPAANMLNIIIKDGDIDGTFAILDISGRLLKVEKVNRVNGIISLDISDLYAGQYLLKFKINGHDVYTKFIKE